MRARDEFGHTALHLAVLSSWRNAVALLLRRGPDVNARDVAGNTPLHLAALHGACFDVLLAGGADPAVRNRERLAPACLKSRGMTGAEARRLGVHKCGKGCGLGKKGRKGKGKGGGGGAYELRLMGLG